MITLNKLSKSLYDMLMARRKITRDSSVMAFTVRVSKHWRLMLEAARGWGADGSREKGERACADVIVDALMWLQKSGCRDIEQLVKDRMESRAVE